MAVTLVEKIRFTLRDRPHRSRLTNSGGISAVATTMTVPASDITSFQRGQFLEFDDDTDEVVEVTSLDESTATLTIRRGIESSTAATHAENASILIDPRFPYLQIADAAQDIVEGELWPHVYETGETTLAYEADGNYAPSVTDIEDVTLVYQISGGETYPIDEWEWTSPEQVGAPFTNGRLIVPYTNDSSTLYVAYRARITLATATDRQLRLIALGTAANLLMLEEGLAAAPDPSTHRGDLAEGSRARIGSLLWERFVNQRNTERISLLEDELILG